MRAGLTEAMKIAFFELRREKLIAHIYSENTRSRQMFLNRGFVLSRKGQQLTEYQLSFSQFLHPTHHGN